MTAVLVATLLTGCAPRAGTPGAPEAPEAPAAEEQPSTEYVAPPVSITWESACMASVEEVTAAMAGYQWQPNGAPQAMDGYAGDTSCEYGETNADSYRHVTIDFRPYDSASTYGWVSANDDLTFSAADPAAGAASACAAATSVPSARGATGLCTESGGVAVVIDPDNLAAVVFPEGQFFYVVQLWGIHGDDQARQPLVTITSLIASRPLVTN